MNPGDWRRLAQGGTSFVELMVAISIIGIALLVLLQQLGISFREAGQNLSRTFAYQKGMALLAELQSGVERGDIPDAETLDLLGDLTGHNEVLTTLVDENGGLLAPDHPMSGNTRRLGRWLWSRVLEVDMPPGQQRLRYVRVKVFQRLDSGSWTLQATVSSVMALPVSAYPSSKTYDLYLIAIGAAPSLWLPLPSVRALIENARQRVVSIDNGLDLKLHWITKLGYGRDSAYAPFVNVTQSASAAAPWVYWYPGHRGVGAPLYEPSYIAGRIRTEAGFAGDYDATSNPAPHAVADQFNHCMRLPRARALHARRVAAGLERWGEPPLQILLDDMATDPERYRNAVLVNLHGPGLPMPPLRNYSDAARDPMNHPGVRVVTHPVRLRTPRDPDGNGVHDDTELARFRVYAYKADPDLGPEVLTEPVTIQIMGLDLSRSINTGGPSKQLQIASLSGGIDVVTGLASGPRGRYRNFAEAPDRPSRSAPYGMYYRAGYIGGAQPYTWIKLYNTPLVAPRVAVRGLSREERLYGMEYVPSPVEAGGEFGIDLSTPGGAGSPKNTARWELHISKRVFEAGFAGGYGVNEDQVVTVTTRIGDDLTTGEMWPVRNQPHNFSETYTWWASSPDAVPPVERSQFLGDPRHNPYADLVVGGATPHRYNWHFDDLRDPFVDASVKWPCFDRDRLQDGFATGVVADVPRLMQLLRTSLQTTGGIWVNPCGATAHELLLGGEIAAPAAVPGRALSPVTLHGDFGGVAGPTPVDSVTPDSSVGLGRHVVTGTGAEPFWAMEWLGELCPDVDYARYLIDGNLPTGSVPGTYHRALRAVESVAHLPAGTDFRFESGSVLGDAGAVAFTDAGTLSSTFVHRTLPGASGGLTSQGKEIVDALGEPVISAVPAERPFELVGRYTGSLPYFRYSASYPKSVLVDLERHFDGPGGTIASGVAALEPGTSSDTAFLCPLGMSPATQQEHDDCAAHALMMAVRSFHRAGNPSVAGRVTQVPLLGIIEPVESTRLERPTSFRLRWQTRFLRFDGRAYTAGYSMSFTEPETDLSYAILYSRDGGLTWRNALDDSPAVAGERPSDPSLLIDDAGSGNESFLLPVPAARFVAGEYLFRVEGYHKTRRVHVGHHQVRVMVAR